MLAHALVHRLNPGSPWAYFGIPGWFACSAFGLWAVARSGGGTLRGVWLRESCRSALATRPEPRPGRH
jgi:hypothetical protein